MESKNVDKLEVILGAGAVILAIMGTISPRELFTAVLIYFWFIR